MIGAYDLAQILGIEPGRYRGRAHQVAEHHCQLTALGGVWRPWRRRGACRLRWTDHRTETCDRFQQALAVAQGDTKLTEVAVCQVGQNFGVDFVFQEHRLIFAQAEAPQPIPDVHDRSPIGCGRS